MCRIFGFRSVFQSQVHRSLIEADNALQLQSQNHPDGWGVGYYLHSAPHVIKFPSKAMGDSLFKKVSGIVTSDTVVAHIRNSTQGPTSILNTHPFQFGPWIFAHNGNIKDFSFHKNELLGLVDTDIRPFILGNTDSEVLFFIILTELKKSVNLSSLNFSFLTLRQACEVAIKKIQSIAGSYSLIDKAENTETFLTFIITNGKLMLAFNGGKTVHYSTYKTSCPIKDSCRYYNQSCENESKDKVNHLIISSEPLSGENVWLPTNPGSFLGIDSQMKFYLSH